ncbi:hypothetical protein BHE74_00020978 [Ensete ventricosum]|nr:hypothetical protein BHE74_00020978 [Ensete ventricosum]
MAIDALGDRSICSGWRGSACTFLRHTGSPYTFLGDVGTAVTELVAFPLSSCCMRVPRVPYGGLDVCTFVLRETEEANENKIGMSPTIGYRRQRMRVIIFPLTKRNCSENTEVLKQVVERGEEAMMSPQGLSNPKPKRRSEWRRPQRSATVLQRWIYHS